MARKLSKLSAPLGLERDYQKRLRAITTRVKDIIDQNIVQFLPEIMAEVEATRPRNDGFFSKLKKKKYYTDDVATKVASLFAATRAQVAADIPQIEIERLTQAAGTQINSWNKDKVHQVFKQGLGVDIFIAEPWLNEELNLFAINNVNLINSNNIAFINETEQIVYNGMRQGLRHEEIAKQILGSGKDELGKVSRFRNAKTRANLIGRDQVNKLNGDLTRLRQTEAGVKSFIWRDVGDTRVRSTHRGFSGNVYSWAKGAGGIFPGQEIQCRCYAEPVFDEALILRYAA